MSIIFFTLRPGYESVQSRTPYGSSTSHLSATTSSSTVPRPSSASSSSTSCLHTPPLSLAGGGRVPRLLPTSAVTSSRGSPTQEQLTSSSSSNLTTNFSSLRLNGRSSSPPTRTNTSPTGEGGRSGTEMGGVGRLGGDGRGVVRVHSLNRTRHPPISAGTGTARTGPSVGSGTGTGNGSGGGSGTGTLTRQQLYRSRNFLHHDLQLPEGYGESEQKKTTFFCHKKGHLLELLSKLVASSSLEM